MENAEVARLRKEIEKLKAAKAHREKALPAHSIRPHQLLAIEELEEEIESRHHKGMFDQEFYRERLTRFEFSIPPAEPARCKIHHHCCHAEHRGGRGLSLER